MFVSMLIVRAVVAELSRQGADVAPLLEIAHLSREQLAEPNETLPLRDFALLVQTAIKRSADPALGLTLGAATPDSALHAVSHLLLAAGTLRQALEAVTAYAPRLAATLRFQLHEADGLATFGYRSSDPTRSVSRFGAEYALSFARTLARRVADERLELREVWFMHDAPSYSERYRAVFDCPVRFGQPLNALVLTQEVLNRPRPYADAALREVLSRVAEQLLVPLSCHERLSVRVQDALRYESDLAHVDFERIAARWGMTRRTLRRRLRLEGAVLADLLDEARFRQAAKDLRRPHDSVKEIAERLGYAETSSFHRAFKRWAGVGPTEYRKQALSERRGLDATGANPGLLG